MTVEFTGRKTAGVASEGRDKPRDGADQIGFFGLGVALSADTKEVGLALGTAFTNRHRYSWQLNWQGKRRSISELPDRMLADFKWYDLSTLHEVLRVPRDLARDRIQKMQSAHMLYKRAGWDRLGDARRDGVTWDNRKLTIGQWCHELGIRYTTLCARLANPDMPMDKVMSRERVLGGKQRQSHMTPEIRRRMLANGVTYQTLYGRLKAGWSMDKALQPPRHYHQKFVPLELQSQVPAGVRLQPSYLIRDNPRPAPVAPEQAYFRVPAPLPPLDPSKVSFENLDDMFAELKQQPGASA